MNTIPTIRLRTFDVNDYMTGVIARTTLTANDVINVPKVYDMSVFNDVVNELFTYNKSHNNKLLVPWHKGNHLVANDRHMGGAWKKSCPTVEALISDMCNAFNVTAAATRVNVYSADGRFHTPDIKPFHHDRSAFTPGLSQNITISLSLGATREVAFKYTKFKADPERPWMFVNSKRSTVPPVVLSNVCDNGSIYAFSRDVNCEFQHGLLPHNERLFKSDRDRVSIIVWGTRKDMDVSQSRVSHRAIPSPYELGVR